MGSENILATSSLPPTFSSLLIIDTTMMGDEAADNNKEFQIRRVLAKHYHAMGFILSFVRTDNRLIPWNCCVSH